MTRYTNLGRKRTYLEASFSNDNAELTPGDVRNKTADNTDGELESQPSQPPAKKQKRVRQKKSKKDDKTSEKAEGKNNDALADHTENDESKQVKQAYSRQSRENNRRREAVKAERADDRRLKRKQEKLANTTCFACREKGHAAKDCPKVKSGKLSDNKAGRTSAVTGICYRCGSSRHTLSRCKKPENPDSPLPFASCFVCSGKGHLASSCPQNQDKGVYPNGGCCKLCGETSHLARNCPTRKQVNESSALLVGTGRSVGADEDDFHSLKRVNAEIGAEEQKEAKMKKRKRKDQDTKANDVSLSRRLANTDRPNPMLSANQAGEKRIVVF